MHLKKVQTFQNISSLNKGMLEDNLVVFRQKRVKPESAITAEHKWHKLIFDPTCNLFQTSLETFKKIRKSVWCICESDDK